MSKHSAFSRREFLRTTRNVAIAAFAGPNIFLNRTRAASGENPGEFIRLGFIGTGGHGNNNLRNFMKNAVAVCDVDKSRAAAAKKRVEETNNRPCAVYGDYRKLLEDKSLDGVVITTPDHWHVLPAIHACEAGKDVYCEKPLTLFIAEGQALVKAVRRYKRVLQTGSQQRSDARFHKACEYIRAGRIGKVKTVKVGLAAVNYEGRAKPPTVPDSEPPADLDYDMWLGPAPRRPYNVNRVHYLFRYFWDFAGGQLTNWGAHHLDITQWALGMDDSGPIEIAGSAVFNAEKLFEVPQQFDITYRYATGTIVECSNSGKFKGGATFEGEKGTIYVNRGALQSTPAEILEEPLDDTASRLYVSRSHSQNWLECIKSRKDPVCSVEIGHRSASVCHLGNISIRAGKPIRWDPTKEQIVGDTEAAKWLTRPYRAPWKLPEA